MCAGWTYPCPFKKKTTSSTKLIYWCQVYDQRFLRPCQREMIKRHIFAQKYCQNSFKCYEKISIFSIPINAIYGIIHNPNFTNKDKSHLKMEVEIIKTNIKE